MMSDDILYRVAELERRLNNIVRMGKVEEVDYDKALCRVRSGDLLTGWLQWATTRAMGEVSWWAPRIGEQIIIFSPCGDIAQGKVMMAFYQDSASAPASSPEVHRHEYPDGAVIQYDEETSTLSADVPGHIKAKAGKTISAEAGEVMTIKSPVINAYGDITCSGSVACADLTVTGDASVGGNAHASSRSGGPI